MIGRVSYFNASRRFALVTPLGQPREHDVFVHEIQFFVAGLPLPTNGQMVEFDVAPDANGSIEAIKLRIPIATATPGLEQVASCGATPAAAFGRLPVAGNLSGGR